MRQLSLIFMLAIGMLHSVAQNLIAPTQQYNAAPQYNFIENKGQLIDQHNQPNTDVKYLFPGKGLNVQLRQQGWSYEVQKIEKKQPRISEATCLPEETESFGRNREPEEATIRTHRIDVQLVGSNPCVELVASAPSKDYINYYTTGTPEEGVTHVRHYPKVTYKDIYPNIDIEFMVTVERGVKYNFIVHPGGNYRDIKLKYEGAQGLGICDAGDAFTISTAYGELREEIPHSYQIINDEMKDVTMQYRTLSGGMIGVKPAHRLVAGNTLVIDPMLVWGTYYGGEVGGDECTGIELGPGNSFYVGGAARSTTNMATTGTHQSIYAGGSGDALLAHFSNGGNRLWATYLGTIGADYFNDIAVDGAGNIYGGGSTSSATFATPGAHQTTYGGGTSDACIAKFNSAGIRLWSSCYGGSSTETVYKLSVDGNANLCTAGFTQSSSGIATAGAHDNTFGSGNAFDAVIAKFDSSGTMQWATYYGNNKADQALSITTDAAGNIYATGNTESTTSIAIAGAHQTQINNDNSVVANDAFIVKFNSAGVRQWGTYYGAMNHEYGRAIAVDSIGNIYITGTTQSSAGIATPGTHQQTYNGGTDAFITKFTNAGVHLWATYYGGSDQDVGEAITVDADGNIYVSGDTESASDIATPDAHQSFFAGVAPFGDAFISKFNNTGTLLWGTYYGGDGDERARSLVVWGVDSIAICGQTASVNRISTPGAHQPYGDVLSDAFIAKLSGAGTSSVPSIVRGNVFADVNTNCINDTPDVNYPRVLVKAEPGPHYGMSDASGNYTLYLPDTAGNYTVSVLTHDSLWQPSCVVALPAQLTTSPDTLDGLNFPVTTTHFCQRLEVDIATRRLRRCITNDFIVTYRNTGYVPANNAYIEIDFGILQPTSSDLPWSGVRGTVYTFPLGTVGFNQSGEFRVVTFLDCAAPFGSTQCVTARIFPDDICFNTDSAYHRRQVQLSGSCIPGDSAEFVIVNTHDSLTFSFYHEIFINNRVASKVHHTIAPDDTLRITQPADGNTVRLEITFNNGGAEYTGPQYTVERCGSPVVLGHVINLPQNDDDNNIETFCDRVRDSWDPNDKQVFPTGVTSNHYIDSLSQLEYLVRFQNTGNDTAFLVIIRDTIDTDVLDIASLTSGASSHNYTFNIYGAGIAEWTFNNIMLPDSFVDEPGSNGFVKFKINLKSGLAPGTVVRNDAAIFFDFNAPVITNEVWNTVLDTVLICEKPAAQFATTVNSASVTITDQTTDALGYLWHFGDGSTLLNVAAPTHLYDSIGTYNVCLYATNECGTDTSCSAVNITSLYSITVSPLADSVFCPAESVSVPFGVSGVFQNDNIFTAQLSDAAGSFTQATAIGTLASASAGTIQVTIPANVLAGNAYRIRVVASNPAVISADNGKDLLISKPATPLVTASGNTTICTGDSVTLTSNQSSGNVWSTGSSGASINVNVAGNYFVRYTDSNGCQSDSSIAVAVNIDALPSPASAGNDLSICIGTGALTLHADGPAIGTGTWQVIQGASIVADTNAIQTPVSNLTAGTHQFVWKVKNGVCPASRDTLHVLGVNPPAVSIANVASSYCSLDAPVALQGNPAGGNFSGTGVANNILTPASVPVGGPYTVTYSYTDTFGCFATTTKQFSTSASISVSLSGLLSKYCDNNAAVQFTTTPQGGTVSGPGISGNTFVPNFAGAGTHHIVYSYDSNGCSSKDTATVEVLAAPAISFTALQTTYCTSDEVTLSATPTGGTFSGAGVSGNRFTPAAVGVGGPHAIAYTVADTNGCQNTEVKSVTVLDTVPLGIAGLETSFCINETAVALTGTPVGGSFSGNGVSGNSFNPTVAGEGSHTLSYTFTGGNGCTGKFNSMVHVHTLPVVTMNPLDSSYCTDAAPVLLAGTPSGGNFNGNGVSAGYFVPQTAGVGTHQIYYTYTDVNGCNNSAMELAKVDACLGINAPQYFEVTITPNPTKERVLVQWSQEAGVCEISISDICGKLLQQQQVPNAQQHELSLAEYSEGIYFITLRGNGMRTLRVVKH